MWKGTLLVGFAVALQLAAAVGGAESLSFHGFLPLENIRGKQPRGDNQPNDVYSHLQPKPFLRPDEDVYYPPTLIGFGLEYGQDPEEKVYQIYSKQELEELRSKQMMKKKHGKSFNKGSHDKGIHSQEQSHGDPNAAPPPPSPIHQGQPPLPSPPSNHHHHPNEPHFQSSENHHSYGSPPPPPPPQYLKKPSFPPPHPHFG
ncbi:uncharacterized protein LOC127001203 [Eriocheir sinensis]|uniref:uncharacterized protein LOC127001203 n=1 Tax=Eriocheir sinensis TaxID=95602 RepID=UPI0021CA210A|nr:uncharacterized protein LOC127001203 [Eriocheir sinensis]